MSSDNQYFDLHFHPLFKQMLCKWEDGTDSTRTPDDLESNIDLHNYLLKIADKDFLHILGSQTSIRQMIAGKLLLGVAGFAGLEYGFAASRTGFGAILQSNLTKPLDMTYFHKVRNGEVSYYRIFLHELGLYLKLAKDTEKAGSAQAITLLSRNSGAAEPQIPADGVSLAIALEGGHNLCRDLVGSKGISDAVDVPAGTVLNELWSDFSDKKPDHDGLPDDDAAGSLERMYAAMCKMKLDLMYITLTHLTHIDQQLLANHAFGMKILQHAAFYPQGYGLENAGKKVIDMAYGLVDGNDNPRPVLIDIKHMSLKSRQDFYSFRKEQNHTLPILATHMGVTGYSIGEWVAANEHNAVATKESVTCCEIVTDPHKAGRWGSVLVKDDYHYNPWSINLMNEDIVAILQSNGLIGMSLDVRILGFQSRLGSLLSSEHAEYLSLHEANDYFGRGSSTDQVLNDQAAAESALIPGKNEHQPLYLCFNIMHILAVAKQMGIKDAWQHITIGSDFDGLVNPVHLCEDSSMRPALEMAMMRWMPVAEQAYHEEHGCGVLLPGPDGTNRNINDEPDTGKLQNIVRSILYDNGRRFVTQWLNNYGFADIAAATEATTAAV